MPKRITVPSTTTYLPAPPPSPLPPPPVPASILAQQQPTLLYPTLPLPSPYLAAPLPPLPYVAATPPPHPSHPTEPLPELPVPQHSSDPICIVTWGPLTYIHNPHPASQKPKVNKNGYLIRKTPAPAPAPNVEKSEKGRPGRVPNLTNVDALLGGQAEVGTGRLQISVEGRSENYTTQVVEMLSDGAVRKTWVTRWAIVTVATERAAGEGVVGDEEEESKSESESWSEDTQDSDDSEDSADNEHCGDGEAKGVIRDVMLERMKRELKKLGFPKP